MSDVDILIIGAGPTGLLTAIDLRRHGIPASSIRIIDCKDRQLDQKKAKAIAIHARSMEVLEDCGTMEGFMKRGKLADGAVFFDQYGVEMCCLTAKMMENKQRVALVLAQYGTEEVLREYLEDTWAVQVEYGTEMKELVFCDDDTSFECLCERADGGSETITSQYVLACDGAHSPIRHLAGIDTEGEDIPLIWTLVDLELTFNNFEPQRERGAHAFMGPNGIVGFAPLHNGAWRLLVDWKKCDEHLIPEELTVAWFQEMVNQRLPNISITLGEPHWITRLEVRQRKAVHFRRGNLFLMGDAAHNHSPSSGQGMNYGLQDAYNLAWKLSLVLLKGANPAILQSFQEERSLAAERVLRLTAQATRLMGYQNIVLIWLRNFIMRFLLHIDSFHRRSVHELGQLSVSYYGASSLCHDVVGWRWRPWDTLCYWTGFRATPRAGDRCPTHFRLTGHDGELTMSDLNGGTQFTLMFFECEDSIIDVERACALLRESVVVASVVVITCDPDAITPSDAFQVLEDVGGECTARMSLGRSTCYLIRPDGHIGFRNQPFEPSAMAAYLQLFDRPDE